MFIAEPIRFPCSNLQYRVKQ